MLKCSIGLDMVNKASKKARMQKISQKSSSEDLLHKELDDVSEIVQFLKSVQLMSHPKAQSPTKLISIKIPQALLDAFRFKSESIGIPYQTMIKNLMHEWLMKGDTRSS